MKSHSLIRAVYLYIFTIVGLALLVIGSVRFIDMGLKIFVFKQAELPEKIQQGFYLGPAVSLERLDKSAQNNGSAETVLTAEEKAAVKSWLAGYKAWQEQQAKIDYLASRRQRDASTNLALILVGLPLYLYHWTIIKKETKENNIA